MTAASRADRPLNWRAFRIALIVCTALAVVVGVLSALFFDRAGYVLGVVGGGVVVSLLALFDQLGPRANRR